MRGFLAIVAGLVVAIVVMIAAGVIGGWLFPVSGQIDARDTEQVKAAFAMSPAGAKATVFLSWLLGTLAGAAIAKRIAGRPWAAWTIAGVMALYVLLSVLLLPMPPWMQVLAVAAPLLAGFVANHLIRTRMTVPQADGDGAI